MMKIKREKNEKSEEFNYQLTTKVVKKSIRYYVECDLNIRNRSIDMNKTVRLFEYQAKDKYGTPKFPDGWESLNLYTRENEEKLEDLITTIVIKELEIIEKDKKDTEEIKEIIKKLNKKGTITIKRR